MKILFLSQYFPPEIGAPSARTYELAKFWIEFGHEVTVITGFPNHPTGILVDSYRGKILQKESIDGIRVVRTWVYITPNKGFFKRIINYLSFMFSSVILGVIPSGKCDVVIATSPQFFTGVAGYLMSLIKRKPLVFEVRDLWPQSIVELGQLKNEFVISILTKIELLLYRKARRVIGVAESTKQILIDRSIDENKIKIVPNGIDCRVFENNKGVNHLRERHNINGKYVVSYIGTHGLSHSLDSVLDCATLLKNKSDLVFMFVGEGAEKENLIKKCEELDLRNVLFVDGQPKSLINGYYRISDICLVTLRDLEIFSKVIPSKIFEIMYCEKPIIGAIRGEAKDILEQSAGAVVVEPENPLALSQAIKDLLENKQKRSAMGRNGKKFVVKKFLRSDLAKRYMSILEEIAGKNKSNEGYRLHSS